ncbi:MAG TPA: mandelate racemase/muconate lactonizing enzyme family protein [Tepidisphaeraceae bacterium]|nr:mandelate racemase/muconate lactonizing enzyme family protein [Tepidisphaeraceae bacterium]
MPIISSIETFILHVPVTRGGIADSTHSISHWGVPGVIIRTDDGLAGYGFAGTHAHLASDRLITSCIANAYGPVLIGKEATEVVHLWDLLVHHPPIQWVGRCGITHLALAAIDIALWDLKAKHAGLPLWKLLGGSAAKRLEAYNTDGGWLNWPTQTLVDDCRRLVEVEGYNGVKIKIGSPEPGRDLDRLEKVRNAIGPRIKLMVDANGKLDLPAAVQIGRRLRDFDVVWFEEPMWYDDVAGHAALARQIDTPIALGEQLYRLDDFRNFVSAGAVHFVQPDVTRLGGITEWWQVADLALAYRLPVAAHVGDMGQIHVHTSIAHPACRILEFIPWIRDCFTDPASVREGYYLTPQQPGAGTTLKPDAFNRFAVR